MTIVDFLLARIAEDEEKASLVLVQSVDTSSGVPLIKHTAIRERVLAECDAKRRIVEQYVAAVKANDEMTDWEGQWVTDAVEDALEATLRALALPYADRPGYREEWRP